MTLPGIAQGRVLTSASKPLGTGLLSELRGSRAQKISHVGRRKDNPILSCFLDSHCIEVDLCSCKSARTVFHEFIGGVLMAIEDLFIECSYSDPCFLLIVHFKVSILRYNVLSFSLGPLILLQCLYTFFLRKYLLFF